MEGNLPHHEISPCVRNVKYKFIILPSWLSYQAKAKGSLVASQYASWDVGSMLLPLCNMNGVGIVGLCLSHQRQAWWTRRRWSLPTPFSISRSFRDHCFRECALNSAIYTRMSARPPHVRRPICSGSVVTRLKWW